MKQAHSCPNAARRVLQLVLSTMWGDVLFFVCQARGTTCFHRPVYARRISFDCCQLCLALLAPPPRVDVPRVPGLTHLVRQGLYSTPNMNSMPYLCAGALDICSGICTCIGSQRRCFHSKLCPAVCWHPSCPGQHILLTRAICRRSGHPVARATTMPQNPSDTWPLVPCP